MNVVNGSILLELASITVVDGRCEVDCCTAEVEPRTSEEDSVIKETPMNLVNLFHKLYIIAPRGRYL